MLKRIAGTGILALIVALPFLLMTRPASATSVDSVCYILNRQPRWGIVIEVDYDEAERLVRRRKATYAYATAFTTFRGHTICIPLPGKK